jgi:hypothetical protein
MQLSDVREEPNNGDSLMSNTNRRTFMMQVVVGGSALAAASQVMAADMVAESDAAAVSLGYKPDATKVDAATKHDKLTIRYTFTDAGSDVDE